MGKSGIFPPGRAIEIVVLAIEILLSEQFGGEELSIVRGIKIPDLHTGRLREVDIGVATIINGRIFKRIVEVRDRGKAVGSAVVDEVVGKMQALGIHRATIVSTSGFTEPALAKVSDKHSILDAIHLRLLSPEELPVEWNDFRVAFPTRDPNMVKKQSNEHSINVDIVSIPGIAFFPLRGLVYSDAISKKGLLIIVFGEVVLECCRGLVTFALPLVSQVSSGFKAAVIPRFLLDSGSYNGQIALDIKPKSTTEGFVFGVPDTDMWKSVISLYRHHNST